MHSVCLPRANAFGAGSWIIFTFTFLGQYVGRAEEYKAAKSALLEGLGLEHLFDHSHELTPKEKEIWMLFDRVDVAELLARDAFAKGAYMLGAEDREIMLK